MCLVDEWRKSSPHSLISTPPRTQAECPSRKTYSQPSLGGGSFLTKEHPPHAGGEPQIRWIFWRNFGFLQVIDRGFGRTAWGPEGQKSQSQSLSLICSLQRLQKPILAIGGTWFSRPKACLACNTLAGNNIWSTNNSLPCCMSDIVNPSQAQHVSLNMI